MDVAVLSAFGGGVALFFAVWRMVAYYDGRAERRFQMFDKANREEHTALLKAISALTERASAVEGKLDMLIALQKPQQSK